MFLGIPADWLLENRVLANTFTPMAISPDSNTIALLGFPDQSHFEVLASSPPGSQPKKLAEATTPPNASFHKMAFSPNGRKLIITNGGGSAWLMRYPSGSIVPVPWLKDMDAIEWLPDSRHVVVEDDRSQAFTIVDTETWKLWMFQIPHRFITFSSHPGHKMGAVSK